MKRRQEAEDKKRSQFDIDIVRTFEMEQTKRQQWDEADKNVIGIMMIITISYSYRYINIDPIFSTFLLFYSNLLHLDCILFCYV